jgi:hypothetical protein
LSQLSNRKLDRAAYQDFRNAKPKAVWNPFNPVAQNPYNSVAQGPFNRAWVARIQMRTSAGDIVDGIDN